MSKHSTRQIAERSVQSLTNKMRAPLYRHIPWVNRELKECGWSRSLNLVIKRHYAYLFCFRTVLPLSQFSLLKLSSGVGPSTLSPGTAQSPSVCSCYLPFTPISDSLLCGRWSFTSLNYIILSLYLTPFGSIHFSQKKTTQSCLRCTWHLGLLCRWTSHCSDRIAKINNFKLK